MTRTRATQLLLLLFALSAPAPARAVERVQWAFETALDIPTTIAFSGFDYATLSTLPQPLVLGTEVGCQGEEWYCQGFRGYADIGYMHFPFTSSTKSMSMFSFELGARYFPSWSGPF